MIGQTVSITLAGLLLLLLVALLTGVIVAAIALAEIVLRLARRTGRLE